MGILAKCVSGAGENIKISNFSLMFIRYVSFYCVFTVQIVQFPVLDFGLDQYGSEPFICGVGQCDSHSSATHVITAVELNRTEVYNVTYPCMLSTLQCRCSGKYPLNQVSHSGRSHPLHLVCGSKVPPSDLWFCGNPMAHYCWEL